MLACLGLIFAGLFILAAQTFNKLESIHNRIHKNNSIPSMYLLPNAMLLLKFSLHNSKERCPNIQSSDTD